VKDVASRGFDVYYVDLEGFGRATRPLAMSMAADLNAPVTSTEAAERHLEAAVSTILQRRKIDRLSIIGFDWGASVAARFASEKPNYVERLAMVAPPWVTAIAHPSATPVPAGAYRAITAEEARQSWVGMAPASEQAALVPQVWFDAFWAANMAVDPIGAGKQPQVVRAPNGPALDYQRFWDQSRAPYDPAKITAAVLVVRGEWDTLSTDIGGRDLASRLIAAAGRTYVAVPGGTHYIMIERGRERLFNAVQQFLEAVGRS
jgi:pimeloyl-ACP methyl ester carboxylesterase